MIYAASLGWLYNAASTLDLHHFRDYKTAQNFWSQALSMAPQCNSHVLQIQALSGLAIIACNQGDCRKGLQLACKAQKIAIATGNIWGELKSLHCQVMCYIHLGDFKGGMKVLTKGMVLVGQAGMQGGDLLMNFEGEVHHQKTEYAEARKIHELTLHRTSPVLSPAMHAYALINIVALDFVTNTSTDMVHNKLQTATAVFQNVQSVQGLSLCKIHHTDLKLCKGDTTGACIEYMQAFTAAYTIDNPLACYCLARLADSTHPVHANSEITNGPLSFLHLQCNL